ncbi:hypothetical protein BLNAU_6061 [Blattamonas nauphoetae]|uniref:Uncharacterized protein n=1 Tax=Blattamonas nauphoetae TaxID=2049346 RepID=A0ABQ9Y5S6_9EUKA|nr:hypothetical protein BLNAU_6061 [Blattamonas nauphoetae]
MKDGLLTWKVNAPAVQQRGQQILSKLREEGVSDEFELYFRRAAFGQGDSFVFQSALLLRFLGGNVPGCEQASFPFQSLVSFVQGGNYLNDEATRKAYLLLRWLPCTIDTAIAAEKILFDLVPTQDHSCSGFTKSMVVLLTSSNKELVKSTLEFLDFVVHYSSFSARFDLLASGFFQLLPTAFYEQEMHLMSLPELFLIENLHRIVLCSHPTSTRRICRERQISTNTFHQIFIDMFLHPIKPFLEFIFHNRRRIRDNGMAEAFSFLLGGLVEHSPFIEEMTQYLLSSSLAIALTDFLHFIKASHVAFFLLRGVKNGIKSWQKEDPVVQKRGALILFKLSEEGLSDEIELHIRCCGDDDKELCGVYIGLKLIHDLGENAPFRWD